MGLNNDFISFAKKIQNRLENEKIQNDKLSQYNSNVFMDECKICFSKTDQLETHHIKDQKYADKNNIIDHHHKNIQHNLVPLCKSCHLKVTNKDLEVTGWIETTVVKNKLLNSTLYLSTAKWEGMPISILEALACGLPTVAFNCPGNADIIKDRAIGSVFNSNDEAINNILNLINDKRYSHIFSLFAELSTFQ